MKSSLKFLNSADLMADCAVKAAVGEGLISELRYNNYKQIYNELKNKRKW